MGTWQRRPRDQRPHHGPAGPRRPVCGTTVGVPSAHREPDLRVAVTVNMDEHYLDIRQRALRQIWLIGASGAGRNDLHLGAPNRQRGQAVIAV
jgi:hypothetical protein